MKYRILFALDFIVFAIVILAMATVPALLAYSSAFDRCAPALSCLPQQLLSATAGFCLPAVMIITMAVVPACYFGFSFVARRNSFSEAQSRARLTTWVVINAALAFFYFGSSSWLRAFSKAAAVVS